MYKDKLIVTLLLLDEVSGEERLGLTPGDNDGWRAYNPAISLIII
jgi:hypothetical protein